MVSGPTQSGNSSSDRSTAAIRPSPSRNERAAPAGVHLMTFEVSYDRRRYSCAVAVEVRELVSASTRGTFTTTVNVTALNLGYIRDPTRCQGAVRVPWTA